MDWAFWLSGAALVLAVIASIAGILYNDILLPDETNQAVSEAVGWDIVTLFLAVPLLGGSMLYVKRGSTKSKLVWMGVLFYMVYTYTSYGMGYAINRLFFVYVALVALPMFAMGLLLLGLEPRLFKPDMSRKMMRYLPHLFTGFAAMIALLWLPDILHTIFTGEPPERIVEAGFRTHIIAMLDYPLLVPLCLLIAAMVRRGDQWGFVLAPIVLIKFVTLATAIIAMVVVSALSNANASAPPLVLFMVLLGITLYMTNSYFQGLKIVENEPALSSSRFPAATGAVK
jgi:hypothetical protein